jgi:hypothetical protein
MFEQLLLGGTGYQPVPPGNLPDGTIRALQARGAIFPKGGPAPPIFKKGPPT